MATAPLRTPEPDSPEQTPPASVPPEVPASPALPVPGPIGRPSLARVLTPKVLLDSSPAEWLWRIGEERRHLLLLATFAAVIFFPYLGAVGFWDPWETHYGEVARSMIVRSDFVHPYWENAYFFSKPILSLWLMAAGMLVADVNAPERGIAVYTEWAVRTPFALLAMGGVLLVYLAVARTMNRRAGIWAAVILATCPLYFFLARQAMVDMPFVSLNTMALCSLMIALFSKERVRDGWLYAFYAFAGLAILAKGLLGLALPGAAVVGYILLSGDWRVLTRVRLFTGALVTVAVAAPWYVAMILFDGKDDESKTFFQRFFIHDHFKRLGFDPTKGQFIAGVHTTTPNSTFVYYLEQLGYGMFPWVAAIPGALAWLLRPAEPVEEPERERRARLFVIAWMLTSFAFFAFVATKFHHYIFPALPPLVMLLSLWIVRLLEDGVRPYRLALLAGGVLFAMVARDLMLDPRHLVDLFTYNYERPYPYSEVDPRPVFGVLVVLAPLVAMAGFAWSQWRPGVAGRGRLSVVGALAILAAVFAIYTSGYHWRKLSPHWSQRDLFWTYHQKSTADEPLVAYQMNWRGETFYSRNTIRQVREATDIRRYVARPGREWALVEHGRLDRLKKTIGPQYKVKVVDRTSNKFLLVSID